VACAAGMCPCKGTPELHGFVLEDATDIYSPVETCEHVVDVYRRRMANQVIGETNQGGDWILSLLRTHPEGSTLAFKGVHAKDGKRLRAEPVASLYEQGKVHHVGLHAKLEDQMCSWDPKDSDESPDAIDAMVHGLTDLLVLSPPPSYPKPALGWRPRR